MIYLVEYDIYSEYYTNKNKCMNERQANDIFVYKIMIGTLSWHMIKIFSYCHISECTHIQIWIWKESKYKYTIMKIAEPFP